MSEDLFTAPISPTHLTPQKPSTNALSQALAGIRIAQEESAENLQTDDSTFNPTVMARRFESLESTRRRRTAKEEEPQKKERAEDEEIIEVQRIEEVCEEFHRKNPEFQSRSLQLLRARIHANDSKEEILRKVLEMYPDPSLADEALDFLLHTSSGELASRIRLAKEDLNAQYGREVRAGKNMAQEARAFSSQGLGTPTGLRDLYREVTGNPRDPNTLFNELSSQFSYEKMKLVIDFLLHSLGSDLKAKGPSIERGELHRLFSETRDLQSILAIFRFFKSRMQLIVAAFTRHGILLSAQINFELLAKQFMRMVQERYPSSDKVLLLAIQLGLSEELLAQLIIFTQMRDAVRQTAPRLFKSDQQRQDLLNAFIDAIEEIDEQMEEEEEKEENEQDGEEKEEA